MCSTRPTPSTPTPSSCTHIHPTFAEPPLLCMKSPRADIVHASYMYIPTTSKLHPNYILTV